MGRAQGCIVLIVCYGHCRQLSTANAAAAKSASKRHD